MDTLDNIDCTEYDQSQTSKVTKDQREIHRLCYSKDIHECTKGLNLLIIFFDQLPNLDQAWVDLTYLSKRPGDTEQEKKLREKAKAFLIEQISKKSKSLEEKDRVRALTAIRNNFALLNNQVVWKNLVLLAQDEVFNISIDASSVLRTAFLEAPDKEEATDDLIDLTDNPNDYTRYRATFTLGYTFDINTKKERVWNKICDLANRTDLIVNRAVASTLDTIIQKLEEDQIPQISIFLHKFSESSDLPLQIAAATTMGFVFEKLEDKELAWRDLQRLGKINNEYMRTMIASSLGNAFPFIPDQKKAYNDLQELSKDYNIHVRSRAFYSLGHIYIYKSSEAEDEDVEKFLLKAIEFFTKATAEKSNKWRSSSKFCSMFHQLEYNIIYDNLYIDDDYINKYFSEILPKINKASVKRKLIDLLLQLSKKIEGKKEADGYDSTVKADFSREVNEELVKKFPLLEEIKIEAPYVGLMLQKSIERKLKESLKAKKPVLSCDDIDRMKKSIDEIKRSIQKIEHFKKLDQSSIDTIASSFRIFLPIVKDQNFSSIIEELRSKRNRENILREVKFLLSCLHLELQEIDELVEDKELIPNIFQILQDIGRIQSCILIVQLSDPHIKNGDEASVRKTQLEADLFQDLQISRLHYLILCGDITNKSLITEYEAAVAFLKPLIDRFKLDRNRICIVPGNHDVSYRQSRASYNLIGKDELPSSLEKESYYLSDDGSYAVRDEQKYALRFACFNKYFYKLIIGEEYPSNYSEQARIIENPEDNLLILGLNSSWKIDHKHQDRSSINMSALTKALTSLTDEKYNGWLKIAVWHHPLSEWGDKKSSFLQLLNTHNFQVCIHGHLHKPNETLYNYNRRFSIHILATGTCGAPVTELESGIPFHYNLLVFDPRKSTITIHSRKRVDENGAWEADPAYIDDEQNYHSWKEVEIENYYSKPFPLS